MASFDTPDSPRGKAHAALIQALTSHDVSLLQRALQEARATECATTDGLRAAQKALDALSRGQRPADAAARKKYAADQLQAAIEKGTEQALEAAMFEAVEAGVEEGFSLAERALALARADRNRCLDLLVESMDMIVVSAEQAQKVGRIGADPAYLERLKAVYQEAVAVAGEEDDVVVCAAQMLDFESGRSAELKELDATLKGHITNMENIVDAVEKQFPYLEAAGDGLSVGAADLGLAATTRASEAFAAKTFKAPTYNQQQQHHHHTQRPGPAAAATATTSVGAPRRASQEASTLTASDRPPTKSPPGSGLSGNSELSGNPGLVAHPGNSGFSGHAGPSGVSSELGLSDVSGGGRHHGGGSSGGAQHHHAGIGTGSAAGGGGGGSGHLGVPSATPPTVSTPRRVSLTVPGVAARSSTPSGGASSGASSVPRQPQRGQRADGASGRSSSPQDRDSSSPASPVVTRTSLAALNVKRPPATTPQSPF